MNFVVAILAHKPVTAFAPLYLTGWIARVAWGRSMHPAVANIYHFLSRYFLRTTKLLTTCIDDSSRLLSSLAYLKVSLIYLINLPNVFAEDSLKIILVNDFDIFYNFASE